jgi:glutamyl-tRNA synthetase
MGDFVIWQRNGEPAYQLASLVDDEEYGMDCIVRGSDLLPSTAAQMWLAERLGYPHFRQARFLHHGLLLDKGGGKLSKSEGAVSLRAMRERWPTPEPLLAGFAAWLGIDAVRPASVADLLPGFAPGRIPLADRTWADFCAVTGLE